MRTLLIAGAAFIALAGLANAEVRRVKKEIARIHTILREKELAEAGGAKK